MPIQAPVLDTRRYQDLLDEALARIPVHTPEWTNFGPSDPGVTLIEVFAFLTEQLLYRCNQIPERNRHRFLSLLGIGLAPASSARGLVSIANVTGPLAVQTLAAGLELRAGDVPFRSARALDVLPLEARCYLKTPFVDTDGQRTLQYNQLYASVKEELPGTATTIKLYRTTAWDGAHDAAVELGRDTVDGCLWIALLLRSADRGRDKALDTARRLLAGKTLNLGLVPALDDAQGRLQAWQAPTAEAETGLRIDAPRLPPGGRLPPEPQARDASYRPLQASAHANLLLEPGVVEITLPGSAQELELWSDLDPLEAGSGQFPPALDDSDLAGRVVTWLRVSAPGARARLLWAGINAVQVMQRDPVLNEPLADGSGEPDQVRVVAHPPLLADSVQLWVADQQGGWERWRRTESLAQAPAEIQVDAARRAPWTGSALAAQGAARGGDANVFELDAESGTLRFGDGLRGRRPPAGARMRVSYDHSRGAQGNVAAGAINTAPELPPGFVVANALRTWGGVAAESAAEGEKQIPRYLQHGDRLVTVADFESIARRTPGVAVGRIEVLPAFNPDLLPDAPGNAAGAVTLMLMPAHDPAHPQAPEPDRLFINAVCRHLDPRRLVTTELILRGPAYVDVWVGLGIEIIATGAAAPEVREAVKQRITDFLAPLRLSGLSAPDQALSFGAGTGMDRGWPLRRAVSAPELAAVASRVPGVRYVKAARLAGSDGVETPEIALQGLQLPRLAGLAVVIGDAPAPKSLMSAAPLADDGSDPAARPTRLVPVPVIPDAC